MNEDLHLARLVQEGLLSEPLNNEHIHLIGTYIPSTQLSGDLYFWQQVRPHLSDGLIEVLGEDCSNKLMHTMRTAPSFEHMVEKSFEHMVENMEKQTQHGKRDDDMTFVSIHIK